MNRTALEEFEELQTQMNEFSLSLEKRLTEKRADLISGKQNHYVRLNELKNQESQLQQELSVQHQKESRIKHTIKESLESLQVQQLKVDELREKQHSMVGQKNKLQNDIDELNKEIEEVSTEITRNRENLANEVKKDYPELMKFETYLGLRVDVLDIDMLKFVFTNVDPGKFDREFSIEISLKGNGLTIVNSFPELGTDTCNRLQDDFNQEQNFVIFLKHTRNSFKQLL